MTERELQGIMTCFAPDAWEFYQPADMEEVLGYFQTAQARINTLVTEVWRLRAEVARLRDENEALRGSRQP